MASKKTYILVIFILSFFAFITLISPSYTGYSILCSDYDNNETACINDAVCTWDFDDDLCIDDPLAFSGATDDQFVEPTNFTPTDPEAIEILNALDNPEVQSFSIVNKIIGMTASPIEMVSENMLIIDYTQEQITQLNSYQNDIDSRVDIKVFYALTMDGYEVTGSHITKKVTIPSPYGYAVEIFNPSVAQTEQDLILITPYEILSYSPLTLSFQISDYFVSYSYIIPEDMSSTLDLLQTGAIPSQLEKIQPVVQATCGDGICHEYLEDEITCPEDCSRKIPWILILTLVIILVALLMFFHFFRDKFKDLKVKGLFKRKEKIFDNETDKENLKNYVKHSLKEGVSKEKVRTILLAKDWDKKQVDTIFKEIQEKEQSKYRESTPLEEKEESEEKPKKEEKSEEPKKEESGGIDDYFETATK